MTSRRREVWLVLGLAAIAALVFVPALRGPWIFDDHQLIEGNRQLHSLANAGGWFAHDFWHGAGLASTLHYWRPLVSASYAVDWTLGGGSPLQLHVTNLLLHAVVAVGVYATLRRWTALVPAAFAGALLWAVHPTKAENVAWISGRPDLVCVAFVLLAAAGIARRLRGARASGLALEAVGTAGAYMCKELAVVLPMFAAVEAWVAAGRPAIDRALVRPLARAVAPQVLVAIAYLAIRSVWLPIGGAAGAHGLVERVRVVLDTYGRYVALVVAPHDLSMQHALLRSHDGSLRDPALYAIAGGIALVATLAAIVALRKRFPAGAVGLAVFVVTLAPTLNLVQSNQQTLVAERFLYLPTLGLALVIAAIPAFAQRRVQLLLAAVALALVGQTLSRAADFADEDQFWKRELAMHPESAAALDYTLSTRITSSLLARIADADQRDADRAAFAADTLDLLVHTLSDRDPAALRALDRRAAALLAHRAPSTSLDALGIAVPIDMTGALAARLPAVAARIEAARAELAGRGGDPAAARADAEAALRACGSCDEAQAALRACGSCDEAQAALALAEARAAAFGPPADADAHYARALELAGAHAEVASPNAEAASPNAAAASRITAARRAARLHDRAGELAELGLWGAAYKAVQPRFDELTARPDDALRFAKLAFHAGQIVDAADALTSAVPADQIPRTLETWAREFGWITSAGGPSSP